jgi:hypothetical protein
MGCHMAKEYKTIDIETSAQKIENFVANGKVALLPIDFQMSFFRFC